MTKARRAGLLWTIAILGLIALAWTGAALYVHLQAGRDVAAMKRGHVEPIPSSPDLQASLEIMGAETRVRLRGCQALPRLVAELAPQAKPSWTRTLSILITTAVYHSHVFERGGLNIQPLRARMSDLQIGKEDSPKVRARKIDALRAWWKAEGAAYHQFWRFWSTACRAPLSKDF